MGITASRTLRASDAPPISPRREQAESGARAPGDTNGRWQSRAAHPKHPAPRFFRKRNSAPGSRLGSLRGKSRGSWPRPSLTCVRAHVPLEVEGVVEALAAETAQVPLHLAVALEVPVEHALQAEGLAAQVAGVNRRVAAAGACGELGQREG